MSDETLMKEGMKRKRGDLMLRRIEVKSLQVILLEQRTINKLLNEISLI